MIRLNRDESGAYYNRGYAKSELERHEEAIADYDEAIRLNPDYAIAYYNRGDQRSKFEDSNKAKRDFQTALQLAEKTGNDNLVAEVKKRFDELESLNVGNDSKDE